MQEKPENAPPRGPHRAQRGREQGAALLALTVLLAVGASAALLYAAGPDARLRADAHADTRRALARAKAALIAYAVTNPTRPGALPCPDADGDGRYRPATADTRGARCAVELGWLPYRTLDMADAVDGAGARLWYAVGEPHWPNRAGAPALNSDTQGALTIDGAGGWAAAVIAPGRALAGQVRRGGTGPFDASADASSFLEGENARISPNGAYSGRGAAGNDRILGISTAELAASVERRVLGTALAALDRYRKSAGNPSRAVPWLSPFDDPLRQREFPAVPGVRDGWLPAPAADGTVATGFEVSWSLDGAGIRLSPPRASAGGAQIADDELLRGSAVVVPAAGGRCVAGAGGNVDCIGETDWAPAGLTPEGEALERRYRFSLRADREARRSESVRWPTARVVRTRAVTLALAPHLGAFDTGRASSALPRRPYVIELQKRIVSAGAARDTRARRLSARRGVAGWLRIAGIAHPPGPGSGELPGWFHRNAWHRYVRLVVAPGRTPGGRPFEAPCTGAAGCLSIVDGNGTRVRGGARAVAVTMGPALAGQQRGGLPAQLGAYFDQRNARAGLDAVQASGPPASFNDRLRVAHVLEGAR